MEIELAPGHYIRVDFTPWIGGVAYVKLRCDFENWPPVGLRVIELFPTTSLHHWRATTLAGIRGYIGQIERARLA
jgi:hypothetical protein